MVARLRHIALSVPDPDKAATFFEQAFGMKRVGQAGIGCYVSDGTINVALLKYDDEVPGFHKGYHGLVHFGMWVDNLEEAAKKATDAGATYFGGRPDNNPNTLRSEVQEPGRDHFRPDAQRLAWCRQGSRPGRKREGSGGVDIPHPAPSLPPRQRRLVLDKEPHAFAQFGGETRRDAAFESAPKQVGLVDRRFRGRQRSDLDGVAGNAWQRRDAQLRQQDRHGV